MSMVKKWVIYTLALLGFGFLSVYLLQFLQAKSQPLIHQLQPQSVAVKKNLDFGRNKMEQNSFIRRNVAMNATGYSSNRQLTRSASISLEVQQIKQTVTKIEQLTKKHGGWVVSSRLQQSESPRQQLANLSIRIPAADLSLVLSQLSAMAITVSEQQINGQDITRQYSDLNTKLKTLKAAYAKLKEIMQQAKRGRDILDAYNQLSSVRRQLDTAKGELHYYQQASKFSLLTITLHTSPIIETPHQQHWALGFTAKKSWIMLKASLRTLTKLTIWGIVYLLPLLLLLGFVLCVLVYVIKLITSAITSRSKPNHCD